MAKGAASCLRTSEVLGTSPAATSNIFEIEQQAGLIRVGPRGRGVELNVSEIVNLWIGHGLFPRNALGQLVPEYRALKPLDVDQWGTVPSLDRVMGQRRGCCFEEAGISLDAYRDTVDVLPKISIDGAWSGEGDPRCYRVLPGETLGEALDKLVDYLADPKGSSLRIALRKSNFGLILRSDKTAEVSFQEEGKTFHTEYRPAHYQISENAFLMSAYFSYAAFEVAADLWADTLNATPLISGKTKAGKAPPPPAPASPDQPASQRTSTLNTSKDTLTHRGASTVEARPDRVPKARKG